MTHNDIQVGKRRSVCAHLRYTLIVDPKYMLPNSQTSFRGVLPEAGLAQGIAVKLAEDYPDPLDEERRGEFQRHVARIVHRYTVVHHTLKLVQRGWESLQQVIRRLEEEQEKLQQKLEDSRQQMTPADGSTLSTSASVKEDKVTMDAKRMRAETAPIRTASTGSTARRRSALFANMKSVLKSVQKEEAQGYAQLTRTRERIAIQTRLSLVSEDLDCQRQLYTSLNTKLARCTEVELEVRLEVCELLQLLDEMFTMEAQYPACFSLKAAGHVLDVADRQSGGREDSLMSSIHSEDNTMQGLAGMVTEIKLPPVQHDAAAYEIPFQPALYTPETEDVLRGQIEEVLDRYLGYRARIDPVLQQLEQERQVRQAQRVDQLMQVIGLGATEVTAVPSLNASFPAPASMTAQPPPPSPQVPLHGTATPVLAIADPDAAMDGKPNMSSQAARGTGDADTHDRALVESALMALDDFEELY